MSGEVIALANIIVPLLVLKGKHNIKFFKMIMRHTQAPNYQPGVEVLVVGNTGLRVTPLGPNIVMCGGVTTARICKGCGFPSMARQQLVLGSVAVLGTVSEVNPSTYMTSNLLSYSVELKVWVAVDSCHQLSVTGSVCCLSAGPVVVDFIVD